MRQPAHRRRRPSGSSKVAFSIDWSGLWSKFGRWLLAGLLVVVLGFVGWRLWSDSDSPTAVEPAKPTFEAAALEEAWLDIIRQYERVTVGIEVWDLATDNKASVNSLEPFRAASITKMITASYALSRVESGDFGMSERLSDGAAFYWHLEQMVKWSNNDSWKRIRDKLGRENEQQYAQQLGLASYNLVDNTVSTDDMARFMVALAKEQLIKRDSIDLLESQMTDTYEERFLPAAAPKEAVIYHKAGTLEDDVHEAAIIEYDGRQYVMVILTNGNGVAAFDIRQNLYKELVDAFFGRLNQAN